MAILDKKIKALIQRVTEARVAVAGAIIGAIGPGLLVFLAVEKGDDPPTLTKMADKIAGLRIFPDDQGKMNLSVRDTAGQILVVSQFTLAADLKKGFRPSFANAEEPKRAAKFCHDFARKLEHLGIPVAEGRFGADMQVHLINDGPVTIWLEFPPPAVTSSPVASRPIHG